MNTQADRGSRVVDSDWIIASVLRIILGAVFHILGICDGPSEKNDSLAPKRKCKFNEDWKVEVCHLGEGNAGIRHHTNFQCCQRVGL